MKTVKRVVLVLFIVSIFSCKKEEIKPIEKRKFYIDSLLTKKNIYCTRDSVTTKP